MSVKEKSLLNPSFGGFGLFGVFLFPFKTSNNNNKSLSKAKMYSMVMNLRGGKRRC